MRTSEASTSFYRSTNLGASWTTEAGPGGNNGVIFSVGGYFWYPAGLPFTTAYYSLTGLAGSWTSVSIPVSAAVVWRGPDNYVYFAATGVGAQVYKVVDKTTFAPVPGVKTVVSNTPVYFINGCYASIGSTLGQTATFHANGKVYRSASLSVNGSYSAGSGGVSVLPAPGFGCITYTANNSPTAIFEG
jgi:hypothetical protein